MQVNLSTISQLGQNVLVDDVILTSQLTSSSITPCPESETGGDGNTETGTTPPTSQVASGSTRVIFTNSLWVDNSNNWTLQFPQTPSDVDVYRLVDSVNYTLVKVEQMYNATTKTLTLVSITPFDGFITY